MREEVKGKVMERVVALFGREDMTEGTRFVEDLNAKSIHYSQMTTYLEDAFDIEIPYMSFRRKETIGEAIDYVTALYEEV